MIDTQALRVEAESKSPRVRSAAANAAAARATVSASRSAYWPTLNLAGNTSWNGSRADDYNLQNQR
ncbi:MAG TPA: TolC family protein, partial [Gemmatimonadales bacterium]|nr:TolC family protein [Gemmatimonadales bacterium]